ncbi:HAD family hydrolase [Enterococcus ratti]|uniref:HAD superfamily hydrolase n=1 Tax=Enterococcus ratti TaxID=150033 RepID=A0A1L8WQV6_9ENTE|nr:HAD family hydrolase [Enterococcus ratti]OJG83212.1 HAD superfamily hydrolase [Enterococcus ratti]
MTEKTSFQKVTEFHQLFDPRLPNEPTAFTKQEAIDRAAFKLEELIELVAAACQGNRELLHEGVKTLHEALDKAEHKMLTKKQWGEAPLVEQVDALTDILYFTYGSFSLLGVDPTQIFDIVHQANMSKLFPDGKPHYHPITKKVLKPANWEQKYAPEPKIAKEIQRQIKEAKTVANISLNASEK